jgi:hypothetical protein
MRDVLSRRSRDVAGQVLAILVRRLAKILKQPIKPWQ